MKIKVLFFLLLFSYLTIAYSSNTAFAESSDNESYWAPSLLNTVNSIDYFHHSSRSWKNYSITGEELHDGDTDTSIGVSNSSYVTVTFPSEVYVGEIIYMADPKIAVSVQNASGSNVAKLNEVTTGSVRSFVVNQNIKTIRLNNSQEWPLSFYELGVFPDIVPLPPDPATTPPGEVKGLKAEPSDHSIHYSFQLPTDSDFKQVNIYNTSGNLLGSTTDSEYTIDSLNSETEYTYIFKTIDTDGNESNGVSITETTLKSPPPKLDGVEYDHNEKGDLIVRWDEPTTGQIKVVIGGKDYATVPASQKQITIPKKDIVLDPMGNEDVKLIPIGEDGQQGEPVKKPTEIDKAEIPFGATDLLSTAGGLLLLVGGFLLLALAFLVVPKLRKSIAEGLKDGSRRRELRTYREGKEPREERISTKEERPQREPRLREARQRHEYRASARDD